MRVVLAIALGISLFGCADEPNFGESTGSVVIDNRLAANRLAANRLAANRLAANRLAANRLAANRLELNVLSASDLLCSPEGREVLSFIVSCAVDSGQTLEATVNLHDCDPSEADEDVTFEFLGDLGLANSWLNHPADRRGKGWVSACLFARVNADSVPVPVSLRGNHPKLQATPDELAGWTLQEGAFFGNYFDFTDPAEPIDWNACMGADQAAGEVGGLITRDCTEPDGTTGNTLCGFHFAGLCGDFANTNHACKLYNEGGTFYQHCQAEPVYGDGAAHGDGHGHGHHHGHHHAQGHGHGHGSGQGNGHGGGHDHHCNGGDAYLQVITTYVLP